MYKISTNHLEVPSLPTLTTAEESGILCMHRELKAVTIFFYFQVPLIVVFPNVIQVDP